MVCREVLSAAHQSREAEAAVDLEGGVLCHHPRDAMWYLPC